MQWDLLRINHLDPSIRGILLGRQHQCQKVFANSSKLFDSFLLMYHSSAHAFAGYVVNDINFSAV